MTCDGAWRPRHRGRIEFALEVAEPVDGEVSTAANSAVVSVLTVRTLTALKAEAKARARMTAMTSHGRLRLA